MDDNYNFHLPEEFSHYVSSRDKTNVASNVLIKNSKNVYKKRSGNWANRPGLKARGQLNATNAGVVASFEWETSFAGTRPIRVTSDGVLSTEYDLGDGQGPLWYNLLTGLTRTRFIFDSSYFDLVQYKEILLACNGGTRKIYNWEGGVTQVASTTAPVAGVITQGYGSGYVTHSLAPTGSGYTIGDILTITGGDGTAKVPVTAVDGSGAVSGLGLIVPQGSGYSVANSVATTGGTGTGALLDILSVYSGGTLTKTGSKTFFQDGFSKLYVINGAGQYNNIATQWKFIDPSTGIVYSYGGGLNSNSLTGITPDPSGINPNTVIMSPFIEVSNIPYPDGQVQFSLLVDFTCDFLKVINNQLYIGSYNNRIVAVSSATDYTDFNFTGVDLGSPFAISVPENPVGISFTVNQNNNNQIPIIFHGTSQYDVLLISTQQVSQGYTTSGGHTTANSKNVLIVGQTTVKFSSNSTPMSQEFIDQNGPYIVWLGQDHQLHILGATKDLFLSNKAPLLSQPVYDELKDVDFTGGALRYMDEYIYITAPLIATHYIYQEREFVDETGTVRTEKIWNPPQISGISRFANITGVTYGHSNLHPMIYQIWDTDQWSDDSETGFQLPYQCVMAIAYGHTPARTKGELRANSGRFDKVYYEGYMARGTPLYANIMLEYQGSHDIQVQTINSVTKPAVLYSYQTAPSLAQEILSDNPLGDGIHPSVNEQDYLPKFRAIRKIKVKGNNVYEYSIEIYSYDLDARWEIITAGTNMVISPEVARELL